MSDFQNQHGRDALTHEKARQDAAEAARTGQPTTADRLTPAEEVEAHRRNGRG